MGYLNPGVDDEQAKQWFKQAATRMPIAGVNLGFIYETVDKNYPAAALAYQEALPKLKLGSSYNLGLIYQYGKGIPMDESKAKGYYQEAVDAGSSKAMVALGNLNLYQKGGENQEEALKWYQKAAQEGQIDAWYRLGMMYEAGLGGGMDIVKAKTAYQKAAEAGDHRAQNALNRLENPSEGQAQKPAKISMMKEFIAKHWYVMKTKSEKMSAEIQYMGVLDQINQGQLPLAKLALEHLLQEHPYYSPAKGLLKRLNQKTTTAGL
jgi:enhanced entry protein EnhC